jgi:organic hydroperoxide reductase OsmC/OhrA
VSQAAAQLDIGLEQESVNVLARFEEQGSVRANTKSGQCLGFEIELVIASPAPEDDLKKLLANAHRMCFTEHALTASIPVTFKHIINSEELAPDPGE